MDYPSKSSSAAGGGAALAFVAAPPPTHNPSNPNRNSYRPWQPPKSPPYYGPNYPNSPNKPPPKAPAPAPKQAGSPYKGPHATAMGGLAISGALAGLWYQINAANLFYQLSHGPVPETVPGVYPDVYERTGWYMCGGPWDCGRGLQPTYLHPTNGTACPVSGPTCNQTQGTGQPVDSQPSGNWAYFVWGFDHWHIYPWSYNGDPLFKMQQNPPQEAFPPWDEVWDSGTAIALPTYPAHWPAVDPMSQPIGQPLAEPKRMPLPYRLLPARVPNPFRAPSEQSERGNDVATSDPRADTRDRPAPGGLPAPGFEIPFPGTSKTKRDRRPRPNRRPHERRPPRRGEKERKARAGNSLTAILLRALNVATEGIDVLKCFYKALPQQYKRGPANGIKAQDMAGAVYDGWGKADLTSLVTCLIENEIEDRMIGAVGQFVARGESLFGTNQIVGFQGRTRPARGAWEDLTRAVEAGKQPFSGVTF